jgi:hypothetical protein
MVSERLWRTRFGADVAIEGRSIKLDEKTHTIVGVMPSSFQFPATDNTFSEAVDLWVPMAMTDEEKRGRANSFDYGVIGRLKPGVTIEQARADIQAVAARMQQAHPEVYKGTVEISASVIGLEEEIVGPVRRVLLVLLGSVGLVLLVGCANVANLGARKGNGNPNGRRRELPPIDSTATHREPSARNDWRRFGAAACDVGDGSDR